MDPGKLGFFERQENSEIPFVDLNQIHDDIATKTNERVELKIIVEKQLANIKDLQKKCEESFVLINQLPKNSSIVTKRFEKALKLSEVVQKRYQKVNELFNIAMKEFDESIILTDKTERQFLTEAESANQRLLLYNTNLTDLRILREYILNTLHKTAEMKKSGIHSTKNFIWEHSELKNKEILVKKRNSIFGLQAMNNEVTKEISEISQKLLLLREKSELYHNTIILDIKSSSEELEDVMYRCEEQKKLLSNIINEISICSTTKKELELKVNIQYWKLKENTEKTEDISKEITFQLSKLKQVKCDLENYITNYHMLEESVRKVSETERIIALTNLRVKELQNENERMIIKKKKVNCEIELTHEAINILRKRINETRRDLESGQDYCEVLRKKCSHLDQVNMVERYSCGQKVLDIHNAMEKLKTKLTPKMEAKFAVNELIKGLITNLSSENHIIINKKAKISALRDLNKKTAADLCASKQSISVKCNNAQEENERKEKKLKNALCEKKSIATLLARANDLGTYLNNLRDNFDDKKRNLKLWSNEHLERKLFEMRKLEAEQQAELDGVKNMASKVEFNYYRLKRLLQQHVVLKKFVDESRTLKDEKFTDMNFDVEDELSMHEYQTPIESPKVPPQSIVYNEWKAPSSYRARKRKYAFQEKTILDLVLESSDTSN